MRKDTSGALLPIGASSLLVIFGVLCLTVFAMLSVSTVQAEERLSEKNREAVEAYYAADTQAEKLLCALRAGAVPEGVQATGQGYAYTCPISDTQELWVEVALDGEEYRVLCWQVRSRVHWQGEDALPVWDGQEERS